MAIMTANESVRFFDEQIKRQAAAGESKLNPFEARALPCARGDVLELGRGLGNLAVAVAQHGARVTALEASEAAIQTLSVRARELELDIGVRREDLADYAPDHDYDCVVAIGLFMFFRVPLPGVNWSVPQRRCGRRELWW